MSRWLRTHFLTVVARCEPRASASVDGTCDDGNVDSAALHHVALDVTDLERSRRFYRDVLGLQEIARPPFGFPGAWFQVGGPGHHVHLIVHEGATLRGSKGIDTRDIHFALRVRSFRAALAELSAHGYRE